MSATRYVRRQSSSLIQRCRTHMFLVLLQGSADAYGATQRRQEHNRYIKQYGPQSPYTVHILYRMIIKSLSDYKHLLQENYCTWNTNIFFSKCTSRSFFFLQHISTLQHVLLLLHGERLIDNQFISTRSPACLQLL